MTQPESKPPRSNELERETALTFRNKFGFNAGDIARRWADSQTYELEDEIVAMMLAFATQVEERERERCYAIAHGMCEGHELWDRACMKIAAAIRERSRG